MSELTKDERSSYIRGLEHDNAALERRLDDRTEKIRCLERVIEKLKKKR